MLIRLLSPALLLAWPAAASAQAPITPPPGHVGTWHSPRPSNVIRTFAGRCGRHSYFISIAPGSTGRLGLQQVRVDGRPVSASRLEGVRKSIVQGTHVMDSSIKECLTNGAARLRLFAVNPDARPVDERFIDFTVDAAGRIRDVQPAD